MRKINEIFCSLQGEGRHAGCPSVFIRFSGCNLNCGFCDTAHSEGVMMGDDEIADAACGYDTEWVILTGGEPSLWIDEAFVKKLKERTGKKIAIETNGTRKLPDGIDWVTVSPKTAAIAANLADEIKVVDTGQPLEEYFSLPCRKEGTLMYLQPCWVPDAGECAANRRRTVARVLADPRWTLSVQLHKFLDIQ